MTHNLKSQLIYLIPPPFFLSIPLTVLILVLLPPMFKKYKGSIEDIEYSPTSEMAKLYYIDLDKDGFSEKIKISIWQNNSTSIEVLAHSGSVIDQFNIQGFYDYRFDLLHGDYNHNGKEEIYFFTRTDDTLIYINQLEFLSDTRAIENRKFVTSIKLHNKNPDLYIDTIGLTDLNKDGFKEILFFIFSGYTLQPRNLFAWDIKKNRILKSPKSYAKLNKLKLIDIDNDGTIEVVGRSFACGNTKGNLGTPYHDHSAWLMVFDNQLNFKYKPIEFKGYGTALYIETLVHRNKKYYVALICNRLKGKEYARILLLDKKLKTLKERILDKKFAKYYRLIKVKTANNNLIWIENKRLNTTEQLNFNLKAIKKFGAHEIFQVLDIDKDKEDEILYRNKNHDKLYIARSDFSHPVEYKIPESVGINYVNMTTRLNGKNKAQFAYQQGNSLYLLNYFENPWYFLQYPFYFLVYGFFVIFFFLIQKVQKKRIEQKYAYERELTKLQIQTIKNQSDPHFIFNALNSISSAIYHEDKDTAYDFLNDFSSLIRAVIINSDKIQISLAEEIEFIENYLRLEKLRFKEKFDYKVDIDKRVDKSTKVPRMVLQTYIENAIKHGIMHAKHNCLLQIAVTNKNKHLEIIIEDNGIGREKAKNRAGFSTGKGLQIMNRIYELYDKLHKVKITQTIEDKKDKEGNGTGTIVKVEIPLKQ